MAKLSPFLLICIALGVFWSAGTPAVAAQDKSAADVKEKKAGAHDGDGDEEVTKADRASVKISKKDAKRIALERVPGKVTDAELEKENGRLQYSIDVRGADGKTYDVEIDAITGEILQAEVEDDDDDDNKTVSKTKVVDKSVTVVKKP